MSGLAEEELGRSPASRWLRIAGGVVLLVLGVAALVYLLKGLGGSGPGPARQVTRISVLPDTPPPPPPPKEEPKREPPKESPKEVKLDQPKPVEQPQPQEAEQLKMEGQAGAGSSPFGAGQVLNEYKGGQIGGGNGGNRMQFAFYTNLLQRHLQNALAKKSDVKRLDYRVVVRVWLGGDGSVRKVELVDSTGSADMDDILRSALKDLPPVAEAPPSNLPQPIKIRITNRVTG